MKFQTLILPIFMLIGCSSAPPKPAEPVKPPVSFQQAQRDADAVRGRSVTWGGTIAAINNLENGTQLEIVARPLDSNGRPRDIDESAGRFRANVSGFLEPQSYAPGREVTVNGQLSGIVNGKIGDYDYDFPLIAADDVKLWSERVRVYRAYPYPYDPFFYPRGLYPHHRAPFVPLYERMDF